MKVKFNDCEFGCFEPHFEIEYKGRKYKAIRVPFVLDNGNEGCIVMADYELQNMMCQESDRPMCNFDGEERRIDEKIAFYPEYNDGVYFCLEEAVGEKILQ